MSALHQSKLRVDWAREKVEQFTFARQRVYEDAMRVVADNPQLEPRDVYFLFRDNLINITIQWVSEFVLHARAALDYIIFIVSQRDAGDEFHPDDDRTQFPIEKAPQLFPRNRKSFLRHLTPEHFAMVEKCQPYNGLHSLLLLNRLSNVDKHREFIHPSFIGMISGIIVPAKAQAESPSSIGEMKGERRHTFQVLLDDGTPIEEALTNIVSEVSEIVNYFDAVLTL